MDVIQLKTPLSKSSSSLPALVDRLSIEPSRNEDLASGGDGDSDQITVISR